MRIRLLALLALASLLGTLIGCTAEKPAVPDASGTPTTDAPVAAPPGDAAGSKLAPGLYDQPDGTVMAIGTLEYQDLEGGFWAVLDGTQAEGNVGSIAAVIANADNFSAETKANKGLAVIVKGKRLEGASIRMAGPEIEATSIEAASDTGGPAE